MSDFARQSTVRSWRFSRFFWPGSLLLWLALVVSCAKPQVDFKALESQTRNLLQLQSCEFFYRDIIFQSKNDKFLGLLTTRDTRLLFAVQLRVRAGVDLGQSLEIRPQSENPGGNGPAVLIRLPPAKITTIDADENSIHQYFTFEYSMFQNQHLSWLDVQDEVNRAKERIRQDAIKNGILTKAWDNAASLVRHLFTLSGFGNIKIEPLLETIPGKPL